MKKRKTIWILRVAVKHCFISILVFSLILILNSFVKLSIDFSNKLIINELESSINSFLTSSFYFFLILYLVLFAISRLSNYLYDMGYNFFRIRLEQVFRKIFMYKTYKTEHEAFFSEKFLNDYSFVDSNINKVIDYVKEILLLFFSSFADFLGIAAVFVAYKPELLLYLVYCAAIHIAISIYTTKNTYNLNKAQTNLNRNISYFGSVLSNRKNAKEIRIQQTQNFFVDIWGKKYKERQCENRKLSSRLCRIDNAITLQNFLFTSGITVYLVYCVTKAEINIGTFVMLFSMIRRSYATVSGLVDKIIGGTLANYKYIEQYVDYLSPITKDEMIDSNKIEYDLPKEENRRFYDLCMKNIRYSYPAQGDKRAIDDISLEIKKGEIVSVLGYNGSGKTTLIKVLIGLLQHKKGEIIINGTETSEISFEDRVQHFNVAFQDYATFSLSLKENVAIGAVEYPISNEELTIAYNRAGINKLLSKLPQQDETILGKQYDPNGIDISGGEWQRVILARTYYHSPDIIIMDEPTASVDPIEEMRMLKHIREYLNGKTAILISHRIGFAKLADRIIMMRDGKIVEQGTHTELLKQNGEYSKLFALQKELYE